MNLTEPQRKLLQLLVDRGGQADLFAVSRPVVRSLTERGLVIEQFIGMRWTHLNITKRGRGALEGGHE